LNKITLGAELSLNGELGDGNSGGTVLEQLRGAVVCERTMVSLDRELSVMQRVTVPSSWFHNEAEERWLADLLGARKQVTPGCFRQSECK
jgi:hypothetical protein